ncbi:hypothetical protein ACN4BX_04125 [Corynebacterium macclintockiae]|uniref:hypothetical protein n=1 Tax=Corynebacterium macclintockiae TaxID=2913501 RepID=UPI003EC04616
MTRTRQTAKKAGAAFERLIADYLAATVDDRIDRRVKTGAHDRGDITGVRTPWNDRVVIECKNTTRMNLGSWLNEAETERINDGAYIGVVAHKRHGKGAPQDQLVTMTLENFAKLLDGKTHHDQP